MRGAALHRQSVAAESRRVSEQLSVLIMHTPAGDGPLVLCWLENVDF
jgi:hypothetical protein